MRWTDCLLALLLTGVPWSCDAQYLGPAIAGTAETFVAPSTTVSTAGALERPDAAVIRLEWLGVEAGFGRHWYRGAGWNEMRRDGFAAHHFCSDGPRLAVAAALPTRGPIAASVALEWAEWERSHDSFSDPERDALDLFASQLQADARVEARIRTDMAFFAEVGGGMDYSRFSLGGPFDRRVSGAATVPMAHAAAGFLACPVRSRAMLTVRLGVSTAVARFPRSSALLDLGGVDAGFEIGARFGNAERGWR